MEEGKVSCILGNKCNSDAVSILKHIKTCLHHILPTPPFHCPANLWVTIRSISRNQWMNLMTTCSFVKRVQFTHKPANTWLWLDAPAQTWHPTSLHLAGQRDYSITSVRTEHFVQHRLESTIQSIRELYTPHPPIPSPLCLYQVCHGQIHAASILTVWRIQKPRLPLLLYRTRPQTSKSSHTRFTTLQHKPILAVLICPFKWY
jgi:hypothetical protein